MRHVCRVLAVSERRACQVLGQPRSTHRYVGEDRPKEKRLVKRLRELSRQYPRYGYRRMTALLRREGWKVNRKRVYRLWRREGLRVPQKQRKRQRLGWTGDKASRRRAEHIDQVWSYDFVEDQTADGRTLKILPIVDEYTRECMTIEVERRMGAREVVSALAYLFSVRGVPEYIRSDNGPEFIAEKVKEWLAVSGAKTLYIEPGSPWENPYSETFNSRFRDELLDREVFDSLAEAQVLVEEFRLEYNHHRPHSGLRYQTPAEFAAACVRSSSATLRWPAHTPVGINPTLITSGT